MEVKLTKLCNAKKNVVLIWLQSVDFANFVSRHKKFVYFFAFNPLKKPEQQFVAYKFRGNAIDTIQWNNMVLI